MIDDCGNFKLISAQCDKFEVKVKVNRQMSIRQENLLLKFPAEKCCTYQLEKLVWSDANTKDLFNLNSNWTYVYLNQGDRWKKNYKSRYLLNNIF